MSQEPDAGGVLVVDLVVRLTQEQLVDTLATMAVCTAIDTAYDLDNVPDWWILNLLVSHLEKYGTHGRPAIPHVEHATWAQNAAERIRPLITKE